jgi:hypothetical protein
MNSGLFAIRSQRFQFLFILIQSSLFQSYDETLSQSYDEASYSQSYETSSPKATLKSPLFTLAVLNN